MLEFLPIVISAQFICLVLILIGVYALIWWLSDNLKSGVQIIIALLRPFFQPQDDLPLKERFGSWAGEFVYIMIYISIFIYYLVMWSESFLMKT